MEKVIEFKFHCRHCQAELGTTDGLRLMIACLIEGEITVMEFRDTTRPRCPRCEKFTPWIKPKSQVKTGVVLREVVVG